MTKTRMHKTKYYVRFNKHMSNEFKIETGLRQGEVLSPVFFKNALETAFRKTQNKYRDLNIRRHCGVLAMNTFILGSDNRKVKIGTNK